MRFSPTTFPGLPHVAVWDSSPMRVSVLSGGCQTLHLWPERNRVVSACFDYLLSPDQLSNGVRELRQVSGGLAGWIIPALEWTQDHLSRVKPEADPRRKLLKVIPKLLKSCRDLPIAEAWKRTCRQLQWKWVAHLREHPEDMDQVPSILRNRYPLKDLERAIRTARGVRWEGDR